MASNAPPESYTYAKAGVSIAAGNALVRAIGPLAKSTARPGADAELGGFGGFFDLKAAGYADPLLVAANDAYWAADAPRLARGLMQMQQRGRWETTPANALGRLAMTGFAAQFETAPVNGRTTVVLSNARQVAVWPAPAPIRLPAADALLSLDHAGSGLPWALVSISAAVPATRPAANGLTLRRQVSAIRQSVPGRWSRGDVLAVRITLAARADTAWVALTDPVPAGAIILGGGLGGRSELLAGGGTSAGQPPDWTERRTGHFRAYWQQLGQAPTTVEYRIRLGSAGRFSLPPARAEAMYAPDINALLPGSTLVVAGTK